MITSSLLLTSLLMTSLLMTSLLLQSVGALGPVQLMEGVSLYHERLSSGETKQYVLRNLVSGQVYEFKVSYPATQPFDFTISFSSSSHTEDLPQRRLLDIEKEEFTPTSDTIFVNVIAHDTQRSIRPSPHVSYTVMYEKVHQGIPAQAYRLIGWLCFCLPCGLGAALWIYRHWYHDKEHHS